MDGDEDYRLRALEKAEIYHAPLDTGARESLTRSFEHIAPDVSWRKDELIVSGRMIPTIRRADGVVWFDFEDICDGPRSQLDYIEIARSFHSVLVSEVPAPRRDAGEPGTALYRAGGRVLRPQRQADPLRRGAAGRSSTPATGWTSNSAAPAAGLEEMQSHDYLARPHLP